MIILPAVLSCHREEKIMKKLDKEEGGGGGGKVVISVVSVKL